MKTESVRRYKLHNDLQPDQARDIVMSENTEAER
jgi:hypothetical protein